MHQLTVEDTNGNIQTWRVPAGSNLREALLSKGISPYTRFTQRLNCGGHGLCATCGVWITTGAPAPTHWHDKAAQRFGYPRLSCQIVINENMNVQLVDKWVWGGREKTASQ
jgi:ferredoxin